MDLHEYQAKTILKGFGLPVPRGSVCRTSAEAEAAAETLGGRCVIKAQVHAGARGKAGGIRIVENPQEARHAAESMLGMKIVTKQTGAEGRIVRTAYVEEACHIGREFYLSLLVDRENETVCIVASGEGGMDIEETAASHPEKIFKCLVNRRVGLQHFQTIKVLQHLETGLDKLPLFSSLLLGLYDVFIHHDMSMLEVNPLVLTDEGTFMILDAKCSVDENALFRQEEIAEMIDYDEMDPRELEARKAGLSYIALEGSIGCMVNGAGLAMATMDIIKLSGGEPANFLDVGGGASQEMVKAGFEILLQDSQVKAILVNIFGGIVQCDMLARGIVDAVHELSISVPLVVRLQGTNVDEGKRILTESRLAIISADSMADAAEKAVRAAGGRS